MQRFTSKCLENSGVLRNRSKKKKQVKPFLFPDEKTAKQETTQQWQKEKPRSNERGFL